MRLAARAGLAAAFGALILWGGAADGGVVVRQVSNGFAGQDADQGLTLQDMYIGENALLIEERSPAELITPTAPAAPASVSAGAFPAALNVTTTAKLAATRPSARYTIVRLDREMIYEVDRQLQMFTELGFDYLRREREKAEADRENNRQIILKKFEGAERAQLLAAQHLREDGKREVKAANLPGEVIHVAGKPYHTRQTAIYVNDERLLDIFTTDEIPFQQPKALLEFYEKSGLFEAEVAKKLAAIEGFPLVIWVRINLEGRLQATIESRALDVTSWPEQPSRFEVPTGFQKVDKFPSFEPGADKNLVKCEFCGKEMPANKAWRPSGPDHKLWFCSSDHYTQYQDKMAREGK